MQVSNEQTTAPVKEQKPIQQLQPKNTCTCSACLPKGQGLQGACACSRSTTNGHRGSEQAVPLIMLQGEWLRKAGFDFRDEVFATMETNRLTIDFEKKKGD